MPVTSAFRKVNSCKFKASWATQESLSIIRRVLGRFAQ